MNELIILCLMACMGVVALAIYCVWEIFYQKVLCKSSKSLSQIIDEI